MRQVLLYPYSTNGETEAQRSYKLGGDKALSPGTLAPETVFWTAIQCYFTSFDEEPQRDAGPSQRNGISRHGDHVACPKEREIGWRIKGEGKRAPRESILEAQQACSPTQRGEGVKA